MSDMIPFQFERNEIRVITIDGDPWMVVADIAAAIEHSNPRELAKLVDEDDVRKVYVVDSRGQRQEAWAVNEPGMYQILVRANVAKAKPFRKWVTHEVLPAIRKTGAYSAKPLSPTEQLIAQARLLHEQEQRIEQAQRQADLAHQRLDQIETACDHYTVLGYSRLFLGQSLTLAEASRLGRRAAQTCKELGIPTGNVPDPRFGRVNTYPKGVLDELFAHAAADIMH